MPKVTVSKNMRIGGKLYRTGDAAPVSRANARVLVAIGHAVPHVEKQARPKVSAHTTQVAAPKPVTAGHPIHTAHVETDHDHHKAKAEASDAPVQAAAKTAPAKSSGSKIDK